MADIVVTTSSDVVNASDGVISLREAIEMANANVDADTITFDASLDGEEINLQSELVITQGTVSINGDVDGDGNVDVVISGDSNDNGMADAGDTSIMTIGSGAIVTLESVHLTEGYARGADGADVGDDGENASAGITNSGTLTVTDSIISDNYAVGGRGYYGIFEPGTNGGSAVAGILNNTGAVLTLTDTLFEDNTAVGGIGEAGSFFSGSDGYDGGDGGSATSGVANFGLTNSNNVLFESGQATGGRGGSGGSGQNGRDGADIAYSNDGYDGYDGGDGGDGGDATVGILNGNTGTLTGTNTGASNGILSAGTGGSGGSGGQGGQGVYYFNPNIGSGSFGSDGGPGANGSAGTPGIVGNTYINQGGDVSGFTDTGSTPFNHGGVIATAGDDILTGSSFYDTIIGLAGNDTFNGGYSTDTIFGGAGNDLIQVTGNSYFDNVHGGSGVDTLDHSNANAYYGIDTFNFATGEMTLNSTSQGILEVSGIEIFLDNDNDNTIIASDTGMTINANGGNDTVTGGIGDDTVSGGLGDDILDGGANGAEGDTVSFADFVSGDGTSGIAVSLSIIGQQTTGAGLDTITNFENVIGSAFNDTITTNGERNSIMAGAGADVIILNGNQPDNAGEVFDGGTGDDTLRFAQSGALTHDLRDDTITSIENLQLDDSLGGGSREILLNADQFGNGGIALDANIIVDSFADNTETLNIDMNGQSSLDLSGLTFSGNTTATNINIVAGSDAENIIGSSITDTVDYSNSAEGVTVFTSGRGGRGGDGQGDRLTDIENIIGSDQQDQIVLNAATAVDNTVNAGDGDDRIRERDGGTNVLNGEDGDDNIFGGTENDTLNGGNDSDNLFGGGGNDTLNGGNDAARDVLFGSSGDDILNGGGGNDALRGNTGMDTLNGGDGTDNLQGGNQNDILNGDAGVDTLDGGAGDDILNGGTGNDRLTGGGSNDIFIFEDGSGIDRITDFNFGSGDQIDLTDFNLADFDAVMALATEVNGDVRIQLDGDDRLILENITLAELDANDFILSAPVM